MQPCKHRHCPGPGLTWAAACVFTGSSPAYSQGAPTVYSPRSSPAHSQARHLRFYRARRLRSNTRPPASAAAAPSPSARFTPVRGNCSPAMGSRVPSGAGAVLGLPGCPGAAVGWVDAVGLAVGWPGPAVGCPGADDAVGPAVGCGEVVGWPVAATVGAPVGWPGVVGVPVGAAVGAGEGWAVGAAV